MSLPLDEHSACNGLRKPCSNHFGVVLTFYYKNPPFLDKIVGANVTHTLEFLQMLHHVFVAMF